MTARQPASVFAGLRTLRRALGGYAIGMAALAFFLFGTTGACGTDCGGAAATWISATAVTLLLVLSFGFAIQMALKDPNTVLTPAVIFTVGTGLFFGFGSMSVFLADPLTIQYSMSGNYGIDAEGLMRTSLLTTVGVTTALVFMQIGMRLQFTGLRRQNSRPAFSLPSIALFFLLAGSLLKYGLVLPEEYGMIQVNVPGTLKSMTPLIDVSFAIMALLAARGSKRWRVVFWILWPLHLGLSTLELSKKVLMLAILLPAAGAYLGHRNWRRVIPWVTFAALAFSSVQHLNTTARLVIQQNTGSIVEADFGERVSLLRSTLSGEYRLSDLSSDAHGAAQVWWLRLNYAGPQLRAMELFDQGIRGDWTLSLAEALIPRFLWPNKPEATAQGRLFHRLISGYSEVTSRVAITVYADGYWQLGWPGTLLFSALMGLILGWITRITYRIIVERNLIYLPVVLLGIQMAALGPTGYFQKTFVGALPILVGYLVLVSLLERFAAGLAHGTSQVAYLKPGRSYTLL